MCLVVIMIYKLCFNVFQNQLLWRNCILKNNIQETYNKSYLIQSTLKNSRIWNSLSQVENTMSNIPTNNVKHNIFVPLTEICYALHCSDHLSYDIVAVSLSYGIVSVSIDRSYNN